MARTKSGGLSKILNFIGLVDDEEPRDTYDDEYNEEEDRSRTYIPRRETRSQQDRTPAPRRRGNEYEPTRLSAPTRQPSNARRGEPRDNQPRRTVGSYASSRNPSRYDYTPRTSRFDNPEPREEQQERRENREQRRSSARSRTVMYTIRALEDCCDVIDNLILNNTVLLNMEGLDNSAMQRCVDTLSGAVFALHATIRKVSERTYLVAPMNVEVDEAYSERRI